MTSPQPPAPTPALTRTLTRSELLRVLDLRVRASSAANSSLCARAEHLPATDRELLLAVYQRGVSVTDLAAAAHVPYRKLTRRLRRIVRRVNHPAFALVVIRAATWETRLAAIGRAHFLGGTNLRDIARAMDLSYHQVRAARDVIETLVATLATKEAA